MRPKAIKSRKYNFKVRMRESNCDITRYISRSQPNGANLNSASNQTRKPSDSCDQEAVNPTKLRNNSCKEGKTNTDLESTKHPEVPKALSEDKTEA